MSTLFHSREDTEDPDLRIYSRRISLRAPPLPNLVSVTFPLLYEIGHLIHNSRCFSSALF